MAASCLYVPQHVLPEKQPEDARKQRRFSARSTVMDPPWEDFACRVWCLGRLITLLTFFLHR